jgi:L-asparaginase / beta-aspartyl-peptidase
MMQPFRRIYTGTFLLLLTLCMTIQSRADDSLKSHLIKIMEAQAADWNDGNIDGFMEAYWKSDKLTFSAGGKVVRGWTATKNRYKEKYRDKKAMGKLTFSEMETEELGADVVLMLGRWHLELPEPKSGNYSLIWRKIEDQWVIIHDHSSSDSQ